MKNTNNKSNSKHIFNSLHEVEAANKSDYIERALIGVFADWLVKVYRAKSLKYAEKILSCVKIVLLITFPNLTIFNANDLWYTGLRGKLKQAYYTKCAENNTSVFGSPSKMEPEDLEILTNMLLSNDDYRASLENRAILVFQWYTLGRISEMGDALLDNLSFKNHLLTLNLWRVKIVLLVSFTLLYIAHRGRPVLFMH